MINVRSFAWRMAFPDCDVVTDAEDVATVRDRSSQENPLATAKTPSDDEYNCHGCLKDEETRSLSLNIVLALYHTLSFKHFDLAGPVDYHTLSK